jgi:hypothetical protein
MILSRVPYTKRCKSLTSVSQGAEAEDGDVDDVRDALLLVVLKLQGISAVPLMAVRAVAQVERLHVVRGKSESPAKRIQLVLRKIF